MAYIAPRSLEESGRVDEDILARWAAEMLSAAVFQYMCTH